MSGAKSVPRPRVKEQARFVIGHVLFRVTVHRENGVTFALFPDVEEAEKKPALFSGHVQRGMATQYRKMAHYFDDLEALLPPEGEG